MSVENLLSRLEKVKRTGNGQWIACCPAHADKTPSLSVRDTGDGHVLVHCFAECSIDSIIGAVGVDMDELFPERPPLTGAPMRRPYPSADVLACLADEALIVAVAAGNLARGVALTDEDRARLLLASIRIEAARELALG